VHFVSIVVKPYVHPGLCDLCVSVVKPMRRCFPHILGLTVLLVAACLPQGSTLHAPLAKEGEVVLYLQPLPQEAVGVRFEIVDVAAVRQDGTAVPLVLSFREVVAARLIGEQRRLARATVPVGTYRGLSVRLGRAFLLGEEGENALLVPQEEVAVAGEFAVREGQYVALFLSMPARAWATQGFRFAPTFFLRGRERLLPRLLGLTTTPETDGLWIFNKKAMQVVDVLAAGAGPHDVVLDQSRERAFLCLSGEDAVQVFDTNTMEPIQTIKLNPGDEPRELALSPDGRTLITANYGSNTASLVDPDSRFEIGRVRVGTGPVSVVVEPRGTRAYVLNSFANSLSVIHVARREVIATVALEESPLRAAVSRTGDRVYVIGEFSPDLLAIDPATLTVAERIYVGGRPLCLTVDRRTDLIYVGTQSGEIAVIDPASRMSIDAIYATGAVQAVTIDSDENTLFAVVPERSTVEKFNLVNRKALAAIELDGGGYDVAVTGER